MSFGHVKKQFPILSRKIHGRPLAYLDNASTTQKPRAVIRAVSDFYARHNANIHRGIYQLSQEATDAYEGVRDQVRKFINAKFRKEIIFTSGTTAGLNLVAFSLAARYLVPGDEIIISEAEHHSNFVPWQMVAQQNRLKLKFIPLTADGRLDLRALGRLLTKKTKLVSLAAASNVTGAIAPLPPIIKAAHRAGALVCVDAAQSAAHLPLDVQKLDCDFLVFSGHKMYGPTGVGVLYGKLALLTRMPPATFGGHMIAEVKKEATTFDEPPMKFEAGTAPIAEVVGLGAAIDFISQAGWRNIQAHEKRLIDLALRKLQAVPGLQLVGPAAACSRLGVFSFTLRGVPAHDIAELLDRDGIAVRSGHHCAQVLHARFRLPATTRASIGIYTTAAEIERLRRGLLKIQRLFHV